MPPHPVSDRPVRIAVVGHGPEAIHVTLDSSLIRSTSSGTADAIVGIAREAHLRLCRGQCRLQGVFCPTVYGACSPRQYPPSAPFDKLVPSLDSWEPVTEAYSLPDWLAEEPLDDPEPPLLFAVGMETVIDNMADAAARRGELSLKELLPGSDVFSVRVLGTESQKPVVSTETHEYALLVPGTVLFAPAAALDRLDAVSGANLHFVNVASSYSRIMLGSLLSLTQGGSLDAHPKVHECLPRIFTARSGPDAVTLFLDFHGFNSSVNWGLDEEKLKIHLGTLLHQRCTRVLKVLQGESSGGGWKDTLGHCVPEKILDRFSTLSTTTSPGTIVRITVSGLDVIVRPTLDWVRSSGDARALPLLERLRRVITAVLLRPLASISSGTASSQFRLLFVGEYMETLRSWFSESGLTFVSSSSLARDLSGIPADRIAGVSIALGVAKSKPEAASISEELAQKQPALCFYGDSSSIGVVDASKSPLVDCYDVLTSLRNWRNPSPKRYDGVGAIEAYMPPGLQHVGSFILQSQQPLEIIDALDPLRSGQHIPAADNNSHEQMESPSLRHVLDELKRHALVSPVLSQSPVNAEPDVIAYRSSCPTVIDQTWRMLSNVKSLHGRVDAPLVRWEQMPGTPDIAFVYFLRWRYDDLGPSAAPNAERILQNDYVWARRNSTLRTRTASRRWTLQEMRVVRADGSSGYMDVVESDGEDLTIYEFKYLPIVDVVYATMKHLRLLDESVTWKTIAPGVVKYFSNRVRVTHPPVGCFQLSDRGKIPAKPLSWPDLRYARHDHDKPLEERGPEEPKEVIVTADACLEDACVELLGYTEPLKLHASHIRAGFADPRIAWVDDPTVRTKVRALVCMAIGGNALPVVKDVETFEMPGYPIAVGVTPLEPDDKETLATIGRYHFGIAKRTDAKPPAKDWPDFDTSSTIGQPST